LGKSGGARADFLRLQTGIVLVAWLRHFGEVLSAGALAAAQLLASDRA